MATARKSRLPVPGIRLRVNSDSDGSSSTKSPFSERHYAKDQDRSANRSAQRSRLPSLESRRRSASVGLLNRDSYGIAKRASSEERKSGNGSNRRFSGLRNSLNNNEFKGAIKETRPLTDKAYQKKKIAEIIEFLEEHAYNHPITAAKLMQPSKKDFENIFHFLVRFWDPTSEIKCLEEDAPRILKNLGYPFIPNKSAFTYVARTNFSSLLGILIYLVDTAKFTMKVDISKLFASGDSDNPEEHSFMLEYIYNCYHSGEDHESAIVPVFEKIILSRYSVNFDELQVENATFKEKLARVQEELEKLEQLKNEIHLQDSHIKQYEEYFLEMQRHKEKKESVIAKLSEEMKQKTSQFHEFEEQLLKRQAVYDAQGFDGKKHLTHYEEQKKELNDSLQKKKAVLRELQDECWKLEIQHTDIVEKGTELCNNFNHTYCQIEDNWKMLICNLQNIEDSDIKNFINNYQQLVIPSDQIRFNSNTLSASFKSHREALEEIQQSIIKVNVLIKTKISEKSEDLTDIEMKKLQISTKLKCTSSDEAKKKEDLDNFRKQTIEEIKVWEKKCEDEIKKLNKLREDVAELQTFIKNRTADLQTVENLKTAKARSLEEYTARQKTFFDQLKSDYKRLVEEMEKAGAEISSTVKKICENNEQ